MLMHQWGNLHQIHLPSCSTIFVIVPLIPIITHPTVQLNNTRYMLNPMHILLAR